MIRPIIILTFSIFRFSLPKMNSYDLTPPPFLRSRRSNLKARIMTPNHTHPAVVTVPCCCVSRTIPERLWKFYPLKSQHPQISADAGTNFTICMYTELSPASQEESSRYLVPTGRILSGNVYIAMRYRLRGAACRDSHRRSKDRQETKNTLKEY